MHERIFKELTSTDCLFPVPQVIFMFPLHPKKNLDQDFDSLKEHIIQIEPTLNT